MARQEKGTRVRTLPGRVQLRDKDAQANSYPTTVRFSTDERPGNQLVKFDDQNVIVFSEVDRFHPSLGLPSGSAWLSTTEASDTNSTAAGAILVPGRTNSGIVDGLQYVQFLSGVALKPFRDCGQDAADATSLANNTFYTTGSAVLQVGEGFSSPLWSKQKIEIDINVNRPSTLALYRANAVANEANGTSFPMAYYNHALKYWEPIGLGFEINSRSSVYDTVETTDVGFINTFFPNGQSFVNVRSAGMCSGDFGFPYHPKFHATSSQLLSMDRYITKPFLLEKAVIELSGSWEVGVVTLGLYDAISARTITSSINTCFLLNQRRNANFTYRKSLGNAGIPRFYGEVTASVPSWRNLNANSSGPTLVNTVRDLVGFSQVYSFALGAAEQEVYDARTLSSSSAILELPITANDVVLTSSVAGETGADWTRKLAISMSMCSPVAGFTTSEDPESVPRSGSFAKTLIWYDNAADYDEIVLSHDGYRTGLGMIEPSSRGLTSDYVRASNSGEVTLVGGVRTFRLFSTPTKHKINPYLLLPTDQLILGWQLPISTNPAQGTTANQHESQMTFHNGNYKLTLYGCYVKEGHEVNETTNQLLSSNAVHEVIE